jgi:hypothetical protein
VKRCKICAELKAYNEFYRAAGMKDGYRSECKVCNLAARAARYADDPQKHIDRVQRWRKENPEHLAAYMRAYRQRPERKRADRDGHLRRKFGIGIEDYERMLEAQGDVCAICKKPRPEERTLHVDHDHDTGKIRGLLCFRCNNALGDFDEHYDLFVKAADYLDRDDVLVSLARERVKALIR